MKFDKACFLAKVDTSGECWIWLEWKDKDGYGKPRVDGKNMRAHRVSWFLFRGDPGAAWVLHKCDTPSCVRPEHLFLGTAADNTADMIAKNRGASGDRNGSRLHPESLTCGDKHWSRLHPERIKRGFAHGSHQHPETVRRGSKHHKARLTDDAVREIRALVSSGVTQTAVAERFGVRQSHISRIVRNKGWSHVNAWAGSGAAQDAELVNPANWRES